MGTACNVVRAVLLAATLAGCHAAAAWTDADEAIWNRYRQERLAAARTLAAEGDGLAATDPAAALDRYTRALIALGLRARLGFDYESVREGLRITGVTPDLPMQQAGLGPGDILVRFAGAELRRMSEGEMTVAMMRDPGVPVRLQVRRGRSTLEMDVVPWHALWNPLNPSAEEDGLLRDLRLRAAQAAARVQSWPEIPSMAQMHAGLAETLGRTAQSREEFAAASGHYRIATLLAPWWRDVYVNHALFQEATQDAIGARESLSLYLASAPGAADVAEANAKLDALAAAAGEQAQLMAWEGFWGEIVNGRTTDSGLRLERSGRILSAKNAAGFEYLRANIIDVHNASAVQRYTPANSGHLAGLIQQCFNGLLEISGSLQLSPDKTRLSVMFVNDFSIDPATCRMLGNNVSTLQYAR